MTTLTWNGGKDWFFNPNAWTPVGTPALGDALTLATGTADARWTVLRGLSISLQIVAGSIPPPSPAPALILGHSIIAADTSITLGGIYGGRTSAAIEVRAFTINDGTITSERSSGYGPTGMSSTLTIDVDNATFINAGTLQSRGSFGGASSLDVDGNAWHSRLANNGIIEAGNDVKLDINVIGQGKIGFGAPFAANTLDYGSPIVEATKAVGGGQTVDFAAAGADSHGELILDDVHDFHALIKNFVSFSGEYLGLTGEDRIVLQGVDVTRFSFYGNSQGGVLTLRDGCETVGSIRFAGSYTTDMFEIRHPSATSSVIELKPTV